jgi:hypothetical protein
VIVEEFDEKKVSRHPKGSGKGGQFKPKKLRDVVKRVADVKVLPLDPEEVTDEVVEALHRKFMKDWGIRYAVEDVTNNLFPNSSLDNIRVVAPATRKWNCVAEALGDRDRWWWPGGRHSDSEMFWPAGIKNVEDGVESFDDLLINHCNGRATGKPIYKKGFKTLVLFGNDDGFGPAATHLAKVLPNKKLVSKLGGNVMVVHDLQEFIDGYYGHPIKIYLVPDEDYAKIRTMK